jgi:uncharacterized protein YjbI with pentapeptide repeats
MSWRSRRRERSESRRASLINELRKAQVVLDGELIGARKSAPKTSLVGADLRDADLRWADLTGSDLRNARLQGALLDGADLSWATLDGADLEGARFGAARLVETMLHGSNLASADLTRVTGLTAVAVRGAQGTRSVRWPPGFSPSQPRVGGPLIHERRTPAR